MSATFVQSTQAHGTVGVLTPTLTSVGAGSLLIGGFFVFGASGGMTIVDSQGDTVAKTVLEVISGDGFLALFSVLNASAGTHIVTCTGAVDTCWGGLQEFSGLTGGGAVDATAVTAIGTNNATATNAALTTVAANALVVTAVVGNESGGVVSFTASGGDTRRENVWASDLRLCLGDQTKASPGSITNSYGFGVTADAWGIITMSFTDAAGGSTVSPFYSNYYRQVVVA